MGNAVAAAPALEAFIGDWRLERRIDDALVGECWSFAGRAVFAPGADGLDYTEEGTLTGTGGRQLRAERRYRWRERAGRVEVLFADGAHFHDIPADAAAPQARHLCGADLYRVRYDFTAWPLWRAEWRVEGPRKNYLLQSSYSR